MFFKNRGLLNLNYFLENVREKTVRIFGDEEDLEEHKKIETHNNIKLMKMMALTGPLLSKFSKNRFFFT